LNQATNPAFLNKLYARSDSLAKRA